MWGKNSHHEVAHQVEGRNWLQWFGCNEVYLNTHPNIAQVFNECVVEYFGNLLVLYPCDVMLYDYINRFVDLFYKKNYGLCTSVALCGILFAIVVFFLQRLFSSNFYRYIDTISWWIVDSVYIYLVSSSNMQVPRFISTYTQICMKYLSMLSRAKNNLLCTMSAAYHTRWFGTW